MFIYRNILSLIFLDIFLSALSVLLTYVLKYEKSLIFFENNVQIAFLLSIAIFIPFFYLFQIYKNLTRFFNIKLLPNFIYACFLSSILIFAISNFLNFEIHGSIIIINGIFFCSLTILSRLIMVLIYDFNLGENNIKKNIILFGAGSAGFHLLNSRSINKEYIIKCIIDDNIEKHFRSIFNVKIYPRSHLEKLINYYNITDIFVSIANIKNKEKIELLNFLSNFTPNVKFLPDINLLLKSSPSAEDLKELNINDLLMRDVKINKNKIKINIYNQKVLITGAGGSIGSELCLETLNYEPKEIIILDHSEYNLYKVENIINEKIIHKKFNIKVIPILASIKDKNRIDKIFKEFRPNIVYHSAAYKHVSIMENNVIESVTNNVIGTLNLVNSSIKYNINRFVLVSSDKAVRPTNIMGASKRFAELIIQAKSNYSKDIGTKFTIVRFGNVIGSSGSVIPKFTEQIRKGGPVTVRDKNVSRYFMVVQEAARLILESDSISKSGEVFVLNMGNPIKISDLAIKMINVSGHKVKFDSNDQEGIEIKYTNLLKSEKLHEELLIGKNNAETCNPDIFKANEEFIEWNSLEPIIENLIKLSNEFNEKSIIEIYKDTTYLNFQGD